MKISKKIFFAITVLWSTIGVSAQNNTISPYSKLGLGDFESMGFGRNAAMGGTGIGVRSPLNLNNLNPAAITSLDSTMVIFEFGVHGDYTRLKTSTETGSKNNANLSYIALGIGINKKWGMSLGLVPYTNVGYTFVTNPPVSGSGETYTTKYEGSGGLSKFYLTNAYKITKNSSLGVNVSFLFGPKNETENYSLTVPDFYEVSLEKSTRYSGIVFDFGYQQVFKLSEKNELVLGLTINAPGMLRSQSTVYEMQRYTGINYTDTLRFEKGNYQFNDFPVNYGGGISYVFDNQLVLSADYSRQNWSKLVVADAFADLIDNNTLAFGLEYTPRRLSQRTPISYRAGANYQSGYYEIDGNTIESLALTAGIGFRMRAMRMNLFAEYKTRGTTNNMLIKEDFVRVGLNVSFFESWLQRYRYR
ncbi:MAG: hypothetical protein AB7S69_08785 [Salinivirgaceae bacterium]